MVTVTEADIAELIARFDDAADAYIRGDHQRYFALFDHPDDYTLMPPYGGETRRGFGLTEKDIEEGGRFFVSGEATLDVEALVRVGRPRRPRRGRAAARRGRGPAGPGHVAAGHVGLPASRQPLADRAPPRRSAGPGASPSSTSPGWPAGWTDSLSRVPRTVEPRWQGRIPGQVTGSVVITTRSVT